MSDHKFTDEEEEVINCLCFYVDRQCNNCDINDSACCVSCVNTEIRDALALINRQKAEIEKLNDLYVAGLESLRLAAEANKDMQAEIERLTTERDEARRDCAVAEHNHQLAVAEREANVRGFAETLQKIAAEQASRVVEAMDEIKVVAIKEFAQRLVAIYENDKTYDRPNAHTLVVTVFRNIDTLVKEMTEELK